MTDASHRLRSAALSERKPTRFRFLPDPVLRAAIATEAGLLRLSGLSFEGEITPVGRRDFRLEARLKAQGDQACVITLAPVPFRIDEVAVVRYSADFTPPEAEEVEMVDETQEALPEVIDLSAVAAEALVLALPLYPRAPGAELGEANFTEAGAEVLTDADLKPFAGLAGLKASLAARSDDDKDEGGAKG